MTTLHLKRRPAEADNQKVKCFAALAFFLPLLATAPSHAITNTVQGTAFGTDYTALATAPSISSVSNGSGRLAIGFAGTTNVTLNHAITGSVTITNRFDTFTLIGGSSSVISNSQTTALFVSGGTNLTIRGGRYLGISGSSAQPPTPGRPVQTNNNLNAGSGAIFANTGNIRISEAAFSGATVTPSTALTMGTDAVEAFNTTLTFTDDGANSSKLTGGNAGSVSRLNGNTLASGGSGLFASGSTLIVSNGTFRGGNGGAAVSGSFFSSSSFGGFGFYATNSTVNVYKGTFTGGTAGSAASTGNGSAITMGGTALAADDSDLSIHGGTFTGGGVGSNPYAVGGAALLVEDSTVLIDGSPVFTGGTGAPALQSYNSDLFIDGGTFAGGALDSGQQFGLISTVDAGALNTVILNSGTFNSIAFKGMGNQFFNTGTNLTVQEYIVQDAGTVTVDHASDAPFQEVYIRGGSMHFNNALTLSNDGWFELGSADSRATLPGIELQSGSTLNLGLGKFMTPGNVGVQGNATLLVSIGQQNSGALFANTVVFGNQSILFADAGSANFGVGSNVVSIIDTTTGISVVDSGGATNTATDTSFAENVDLKSSESGRTKLSGATIDGGGLSLQFNTESLKDYWNAAGQMATLAGELDRINNPVMMSIIDGINNPYISKAAVEQTYFTTMNTFQTSLLGLQAALGQTTARGIEFREQLKLDPGGARGPDFEPANTLRAWGKYYGHFINRDKEGLNSSYDTILQGGVIGVDQSFGNLLLGVSGGAGFYSTSTDNDADEDINAYSAALYSTYYFPRAYIDAGVAYGFNDVSTKTAEPFRLDGDFDANLISAYFGGGYDLIDTKGGTVFTPEASLQYTYYEQDSYTETGITAVPRQIDEYDAYSIRSSLGINTSMLNTEALEEFGFKIDGRMHWMHEFNADPDDMTFSLAGGTADYQLVPPSLEEDLFRIGIGCAFFNTRQNKPKNVMLRLDFDELFGDGFNSHNVSAKLVYAF